MNNINNKMKRALMLTTFILIMVGFVSAANHPMCIKKGDSYPCPNTEKICKSDYCYFCVNDNGCIVYDKNCMGEVKCSNNNTPIDKKPPVMTLNSPSDNQIYNKKSVLFSLTTDELANLYYRYSQDSENSWKKLLTKSTSLSKEIALKEGLNEIIIKAVDMRGNEALVNRRFVVDSQKPKITKTNPSSKKFTNGSFEINFVEDNPQSLLIFYGAKNLNIDPNSCENYDKGKHICNIKIPLNEFNGRSLEYSLRLTDIANNSFSTKPVILYVDTIPPVFENPSSIINIDKKNVYFEIKINESNFKSISYYDNSNKNPKWITLCTSLKNNICKKKLSFTPGNHALSIKAEDKAGNSAIIGVEFNIF